MIAFAGKANLATLVTGISQEKLNIVHRWVAWMSFELAWAHTIPFFWVPYTDGGAANWGGVPLLIIAPSLRLISTNNSRLILRDFLSRNALDSWVYLWATRALWLATWIARAFWYTQLLDIHNQWFIGAPTTLCQLPNDMVRMEILAPRGFKFLPAQHCFLRFPFLWPFDNHPFTIASTPQSPSQK
ncbi:hypothetical protein BDZ45DRAFT_797529 [Acephala macrosclerotiorum]|nr:hypothetical protein BDZ45DRAFT_797529 [Acephala macrosclerotiorum]